MRNQFSVALLAATLVFGPAVSAQSPAPIAHYYNPSWSPDGKTIAFESTRDGNSAIFTVRRDGTALTKLTASDVIAEQPAWSPNGKQIVFAYRRESERRLHVMIADGSQLAPIAGTDRGFYASFSPDGKCITYSTQGDRQLTGDARIFDYHAYVVRADGRNHVLIGDSTASGEGPRWSSDGTRIVYSEVAVLTRQSAEAPRDFARRRNSATQQFSIRPDNSDKQLVSVENAQALIRDVQLSHDGTWRVLSKNENGARGIFVVEVSTGKERMVAGESGTKDD